MALHVVGLYECMDLQEGGRHLFEDTIPALAWGLERWLRKSRENLRKIGNSAEIWNALFPNTSLGRSNM
jgi:hypothetical protein